MTETSVSRLLPRSALLIAMTVGLLQGAAGWLAHACWPDDMFGQAIWLALFDAVLVGGLCVQLLLKQTLVRLEWLMAIGTGLLFGAISWWSVNQMAAASNASHYNGENFFSLFWFLLLLAYVLIPYIQSWRNRSDGRFVYHDLYRHSWDNFFIVCVGLLLTGIFWLLIVLWASLFDMLRVHLFSDFFYSKGFCWLAPFAVTGLGITIGINNERVIGTLRNIALAICRFMMPLTAIITILFTAALPFTGLQPVWDTNHASPILLTLVAANVFFVNGVFQDGEDVHFARPLRMLANLSLCLLPVLVTLAAYSTWLRIDQHGLSPARIYAALIALVGSCYSVSYAWNATRRQTAWLMGNRAVNIYTGLLICALIVLTHSPLFDPKALSARHQYQRLLDGRVDAAQFDYGNLRYKLGAPGEQYLKKIRELQAHPQLPVIREKITLLDNVNNYYDWQANLQDPAYKKPVLEVLGGGEVPAGFSEALHVRECERSCSLLLVDVNNDGVKEVLLFNRQDSFYALPVYAFKDGHWVKFGAYSNSDQGKYVEWDALQRAIDQQVIKTEQPAVQDLLIGESRWNFTKH